MDTVPNRECLLVHRKQGLFLSVFVDDIKKKQNMARMWKKLMKHVDLDEPTSFLDHVHLGCTQRKCKPNESTLKEYRGMFQSRISAVTTEKTGWEKLTQRRLRGPATWKGMLKNALRDIANWQTKGQSSYTES